MHELDADTAPPDLQATFGIEMSRTAQVANLVLLITAVVAASAFLWIMSSLPRIDGTVPVSGLRQPATVARDDAGIPRIAAKSIHDAYFALGWVHAQDRLWQMELQRRIGAGRLAELVGEAGLGNDRFMRTLGLYRLAEAGFEQLDKPTRDVLTAYTEGVNAWLTSHRHRLPPQFLMLGARPEPWQPADSLVWGRLLALQLSNNWKDEVLKGKLARNLDTRRLGELWPGYPAEAPVTLSAATADAILATLPEAAQPHLASNVWAVSGGRSATGKPLLANDPHLGFRAPVLWYLAKLDAPGLSLTGATVPGVPFHLIGHNGRIAWGTTTTHADTVDLVVERPAGDGAYVTPRGPLPFRSRDETIRVRNAADVTLTIRETIHGPVISDLGITGGDQVVALRATFLEPEDRTAQALLRMNRAVDWRTFSVALADFHAPVQNFAFADTRDTIAFATAGRVPVRRGADGAVPLRGWTREAEWTGWVPPEKLPRVVNPRAGVIVNANNRVAGPRYPYAIATAWPEGYRAQRIQDLLGRAQGLDTEAMAAMQMDALSLAAAEVKDLLGVPEAALPLAAEAARRIAAWDATMAADKPEPLIFATWMKHLWRRLFADELGADFASFDLLRPYVLGAALTRNRHWCDDVATTEAESCDQQIAASLDGAVAELAARHGSGIETWRWGAVHRAIFADPVIDRLPLLAGWFRIDLATDGDDFTISRGSYDPEGFRHLHGAGLRVVFDLADLDDSRFVTATGQSGNPLSRHFGDMAHLWAGNKGVPIGPAPEGAAVLTLEPGL
ncbi:penicillin acylase family protein [Magnetospirillum sp. UT-4]|uniref:penicillin acylase family protein n=1 Tax=Magnetospirillum sp. UT-4 TaxID=2681467 RepID=UPI0013860A38|nr:penicillin acylase family protein [Magnetospirillum sp. UT-4]CAA7617734.1 Peptidase S45, penicillin amidase [Magnetospirillum sp. UT-4]